MRYIVILIFVSILFGQDTIELRSGYIGTGKLLDITATHVVFKEIGVLDSSITQIFHVAVETVTRVILSDGTVIFEEGNIMASFARAPVPHHYEASPIDRSFAGPLLIGFSAAIGLYNNNRETPDDPAELEDHIDSIIFVTNLQYAALLVGSIIMLIERVKDSTRESSRSQ